MARIVGERADLIPRLGEVFREHGFEGASLALISGATGFGKGSLYHFFPGGKEEMAAAVLEDIDHWFEQQVFTPLRTGTDAVAGIRQMLASVDDYFRSGRRTCLVGFFALSDVRDRFGTKIAGYFLAWTTALSLTLERAGHLPGDAHLLAEDAIASIQGSLVVARALDDPSLFPRMLKRVEQRLLIVAHPRGDDSPEVRGPSLLTDRTEQSAKR